MFFLFGQLGISEAKLVSLNHYGGRMKQCCKCGGTFVTGPMYKKELLGGGALSECLEYRCTNCGYSWGEKTLEQIEKDFLMSTSSNSAPATGDK